MKVLVTGGSGFLGINLIRHLYAKGFELVNLDITEFDYPDMKGIIKDVRGDIRKEADVERAMEGVDYVVTFSDPDVNRLLRLLRPDVHCKGTDYTADTVPERETVLAYGGRIAIVGDPKDHSTRDLLARIKSAS